MARAGLTGRKSAKAPANPSRRADASLTVSLAQFLVGGTDLQFREFVADLFAAAAGMQSLRRALAKSIGLSAAEFSVLLATWYLQRRGPVGVTAIARHLHVASAHVTAEVGNLVNAGLIGKTQDAKDTRAVILVLSQRGEEILAELAPLLRRINDRLFSGNTANAINVVARFLRHVADESTNSVAIVRHFSSEKSLARKPSGETDR
jgi:DNA-binding MarR family transcriptional regulator